MHFVSDKSLQRSGWIYNDYGVGYPEAAETFIQWEHVDGPLMYLRNGQLHWLTWRERLGLWFGLTDVASIEMKYLK